MSAPTRVFVVPLNDLQQPITQEMLVDDGHVLKFEQHLVRGKPSQIDLVIENPGLVLLRQTPYLAVVETPTGLLADAMVLGRARMFRIPDDFGGMRITLKLMCAPASWKSLIRTAANNSVAGAGIAPYQVPIIPDPGQGVISVAFSSSLSATWAAIGKGAIAASSHFQQDLTRTPLSTVLPFNTLSIANAILTLTVQDSPIVRDAALNRRAAIVAVSGDKDPTHGVPYAAGVVQLIRPAPGGKVDVIISLASTELARAGIVPVSGGDTTSGGLPYYDALFQGARSDLSTEVLQGRYAAWHIDPDSHRITIDDALNGKRVVDLGDSGIAASERRNVVKSAVQHVRLKLVCDFTQSAVGSINFAPMVALAGNYGSFTTLAYGGQAFPPSRTGGNTNVGWTLSAPTITTSQALGPELWTGRTFAVTYREDTMYWNYFTDVYGQAKATNAWSQGIPFEVQHSERACFAITTVNYLSWLAAYNYTQTRREVVDIVLDVESQDFALGEAVLDLGTLSLSDVNSVEGIAPYADGVAYNRGDRVNVRGRIYEAVADRVVSFYKISTSIRNGKVSTTLDTPYWRDLGYSTAMGDPKRPSYFDSARGLGTIEAAIMRMRAAALRRLGAMRVRKTFPWDVAKNITLQDEVRMLIRDGRRILPVRGKVEEITRRIEGKGVAAVDITITVMAGTGRNDRLGPVPAGYLAEGLVDPSVATPPAQPRFVSSTVPGFIKSLQVNGDVEYALSGDDLQTPIDVYKLSDLNYSVLSVQFLNGASDQIARCANMIASNRSPMYVTQDYPTTLDVALRPIRSDGNLIRNYTCHAMMTVSPRGVDYTNGGEP